MILLQSGSLFADRFEIERPAASGGMGTIYRARDRATGNTIALKLLNSEATDPGEIERFAREAQLLAELQHPGIVAYIDHGRTHHGRCFLAMEWLDGENLANRIARGPLSLRDSLLLLQQVSTALAQAHQRGIIHRDVKPTNIFLVGGDLNQVKLLDFGIARRAAASQAMTRTGLVIGTPEYMAPEQVRGVREIGPAADIFSLGCILYECLVGHPPFMAEHIAAVLARILFEDPAPVSEHRSGIPDPIVTLLNRMLAKDASRRHPDAAALCRHLLELDGFRESSAQFAVPSSAGVGLFAEGERSLFSVVVASPSLGRGTDAAAGAPADSPARNQPIHPELDLPGGRGIVAERVHTELIIGSSLHRVVHSLGAQAEYLLDGSLIVTFRGAGSAIDLAARAAHCALMLKDRWPDAELAMATGHGSVRGRLPVGEAVDRAAGLLQSHLAPPPAGSGRQDGPKAAGVWLDELSAHLLERHFSVRAEPAGFLLSYEHANTDEARPLLGKPTACVGREQELRILDALLIGCIEESAARVVLVTAPPGGGKSRLRHEFLRRISSRAEPPTILIGRGDMMNAGAPYHMIRDALRRLCGITGSESREQQRDKLAARGGQYVAADKRRKVVAFLGEICNIPFPEETCSQLHSARRDPKIMGDQITEAFLDFLRADVAELPVLLVLEDLHWGDSLTTKLIEHALRELSTRPFMVVALARPDVHELFPKLWQAHNVMELLLGSLSRRASERLIHQILGDQVSAETVTRLIEQSSGSPLYLEELIRAYSVGKLEALPVTVLAMMQARLGRLEPGQRRLLLAASVFGDVFWRDGIHALCGTEQTLMELEHGLQQLVAAELIEPHRQSRLNTEAQYGFRQSLLREAAYGLLTENNRPIGHRLAADFLETAGESDPNIMASHHQRGEQPERAAPWFLRAAEQCLANNDLSGTLARADLALACGAQGELAGQLYALKAWACAWRGEAAASLPLAKKSVGLLPAGSYYWSSAMAALLANTGMLRLHDELAELTRQFLAAEPPIAAVGEYVQTASRMVSIFSLLGLPELARVYFARAQAVGAAAPEDSLVQRWLLYGKACDACLASAPPFEVLALAQQATCAFRDSGDLRNAVFSCGLTAEMLCELGDRAQAAAVLREPISVMQRLDERYLMVFLNTHLAWALCGQPDEPERAEAAALADALIAAADIIPTYKGWAHAVRAQLAAAAGRLTEAEAEARSAMQLLRETPTLRERARKLLMEVLLQQGRPSEVLQLAPEGLGGERSSKLGVCELGIRLAQAEALWALGERSQAGQLLLGALALIQARADEIPSRQWQDKFLHCIPEHLRARELARQWLHAGQMVAEPIPGSPEAG